MRAGSRQLVQCPPICSDDFVIQNFLFNLFLQQMTFYTSISFTAPHLGYILVKNVFRYCIQYCNRYQDLIQSSSNELIGLRETKANKRQFRNVWKMLKKSLDQNMEYRIWKYGRLEFFLDFIQSTEFMVTSFCWGTLNILHLLGN